MTSPLLLLDGIFVQEGGQISVHMDGERHPLDGALVPLIGHAVTVSLHHFPPQAVDNSLPGGGSCLWGGHCPHGHRENPGWLHHQAASGVLSGGGGDWSVGGVILRFGLMPGHHGRLIVLDDEALKEPPADSSVDDLVREAEQMTELLEALKGVIRE